MTTKGENRDIKVTVIGTGVMGSSMAKSIRKAGYSVTGADPFPKAARELEKLGIKLTDDNSSAVSWADLVFFAVKPYNVIPLAKELGKLLDGKLCISIAAGLDLESLAEALPKVKWVRAMPNTAVAVQRGFIVYTPGRLVEETDASLAETLFRTMGEVERVEEKLIDPLTGISGSGPAFIYTVIEALAIGGVKVGVPADLAKKAAACTTRGAAELFLEKGVHPAELRDQVMTPAGTTVDGVYELEKAGVRPGIMNAVIAAAGKASAMAEAAGKKSDRKDDNI